MSGMGQSSSSEDGLKRRYRIGVLLYIRGADGRILLIKRKRSPNAGLWCAVGGKLEMAVGESPYECAAREAREEVGLELMSTDLKLRCMLSEENYEGSGHWLMFIFLIDTGLSETPDAIDEGDFSFFEEPNLHDLEMPTMDRYILMKFVLGETDGFTSLHAPVGAENDPDLLRLIEKTP